MNSISLTAARAIAAAITPRYGGQIVEELVTVTHDNRQEIYRWSNGDVIEFCKHGAYVSRIGDPAAMLIDLEMIARAGDEWPDSYMIESQTVADLRNRTGTSGRTETQRFTPAELDSAFGGVETLGSLVTGSARRSVRAVRMHTPPTGIAAVDVDQAFDETFGGAT